MVHVRSWVFLGVEDLDIESSMIDNSGGLKVLPGHWKFNVMFYPHSQPHLTVNHFLWILTDPIISNLWRAKNQRPLDRNNPSNQKKKKKLKQQKLHMVSLMTKSKCVQMDASLVRRANSVILDIHSGRLVSKVYLCVIPD